jgi:hypothetical protein
MIQHIACDIKEIVMSTGYVNTHYEYCELITRSGTTFPAQYVGGGNYQQVNNHDVNGNSYLRRNGNASFSKPSGIYSIKTTSCKDSELVEMTIPFRLVMVVPRKNLEDNAFSDDLLAQEVIGQIVAGGNLQIDGVNSVTYNVTGYDIDALKIWADEIKGVEYQMNFNLAYIAININAVSIMNPACLRTVCTPPTPPCPSPCLVIESLDDLPVNGDGCGFVRANIDTGTNLITYFYLWQVDQWRDVAALNIEYADGVFKSVAFALSSGWSMTFQGDTYTGVDGFALDPPVDTITGTQFINGDCVYPLGEFNVPVVPVEILCLYTFEIEAVLNAWVYLPPSAMIMTDGVNTTSGNDFLATSVQEFRQFYPNINFGVAGKYTTVNYPDGGALYLWCLIPQGDTPPSGWQITSVIYNDDPIDIVWTAQDCDGRLTKCYEFTIDNYDDPLLLLNQILMIDPNGTPYDSPGASAFDYPNYATLITDGIMAFGGNTCTVQVQTVGSSQVYTVQNFYGELVQIIFNDYNNEPPTSVEITINEIPCL